MRYPSQARKLSKLVELIAFLGVASEVELQARTLMSFDELHRYIDQLVDQGHVKRRSRFFASGFGDGLELTRSGYCRRATSTLAVS